MSVKVNTTPNSTATPVIGSSSGSSMSNSRRQKLAPSISAASLISWGIELMPASRITVASGSMRQVCTDRKSTRLNSSHGSISYAVFCLKKKKKKKTNTCLKKKNKKKIKKYKTKNH